MPSESLTVAVIFKLLSGSTLILSLMPLSVTCGVSFSPLCGLACVVNENDACAAAVPTRFFTRSDTTTEYVVE